MAEQRSDRIGWLLRAAALALAGLVLSCGRSSRPIAGKPAPPPALDIALEEVFTLGADPSAPAEEIFGRVRGVRTDGRGDIYVADAGTMAVRVYDRAGRYVRSLGGRGRGAGRFLDITAFHVTPEGELVVADGLAHRLSRFASDGRFLGAVALDDFVLLWPRDLKTLGADRYVFLCKMPAENSAGDRRPDADDLFHVFDRGMRKTAAFGELRDLAREDDPAVELFNERYPGRLWIDGREAFLYAPSIYEGEIYRYQGRGGAWQRAQTLAGHVPGAGVVVLAPEKTERGPLIFRVRSRRGRVAAAVRNASLGVFRLRDGRIVHFSLTTPGGKRVLGAEIFNRDGRLSGYGAIEELRDWDPSLSFFPVTVEWMDSEDRFYLVDSRSDPVVRVVKLRWRERQGGQAPAVGG